MSNIVQSNPIDLTTLARVRNWIGASSNSDDQTLQDCITAFSAYVLRRTGRGPEDGSIPAISPFNQVLNYDDILDGSGGSRQFTRNWPIQSVTSVTVDGISLVQSSGPGQPGWCVDGGKASIAFRGSVGFGGVGRVGFASLAGAYSGGAQSRPFRAGIQNVEIVYTAGFPALSIPGELWTIPATPFQILVNNAWLSDQGVTAFSGGAPLTKVNTSPATGQYAVLGGGNYLFASADAGVQVLISYLSPGTPEDLEMMARKTISLNYVRKGWIGQKSRALAQGAGTVTYNEWDLDDEARSIIRYYRRSVMNG